MALFRGNFFVPIQSKIYQKFPQDNSVMTGETNPHRLWYTGKLAYDGPPYDGFSHMTDQLHGTLQFILI